MALNALDGMLARDFGQKSNLGAYLNELTDVVSDAFLYLPFAYLPGFEPLWIGVIIALSGISELAGVLAIMTGASRRNDGPMGKAIERWPLERRHCGSEREDNSRPGRHGRFR